MAKEKKRKFKWYYIIPILFLAAAIAFVYVIFGNTPNGEPVYGRRCEHIETKISNEQIKAANTAIDVDGLVSGNLVVNCMTVDITLSFDETVSLEDAETKADAITLLVDKSLGFEKYNPEDKYSKIFTDNEFDRMYDIQITIFGANNAYTVFGYKSYQLTDVVYTTNLPKDQTLVDNLHQQQAAPAETTTTTTTE